MYVISYECLQQVYLIQSNSMALDELLLQRYEGAQMTTSHMKRLTLRLGLPVMFLIGIR